MLSLRTRAFIIINLVILLILGVSILLLVLNKKKSSETAANNQPAVTEPADAGSASVPPGTAAVPATARPRQPTTLEAEQNGAVQIAKVFIERYGTYSTQNDYINIKEIETLVTPSLWASLSARLKAPAGKTFVGVTTAVFSSELKDWKGDSAAVELNTKKVTDTNGALTTAYQRVTVQLVKQNGKWLVESFKWE